MKQGKPNRTLIEKNESGLPQGILTACWAKDQRKSKGSAVMAEISIEHPIAIVSTLTKWPTSYGVSNCNGRGQPPNLGTQMTVDKKTGAPKNKSKHMCKHEAIVKRLQQRIAKAIEENRYAWALRRHPSKGKRWVYRRYFLPNHGFFNQWDKKSSQNPKLVSSVHWESVVIKKVRKHANPFHPAWSDYFAKRRAGLIYRG